MFQMGWNHQLDIVRCFFLVSLPFFPWRCEISILGAEDSGKNDRPNCWLVLGRMRGWKDTAANTICSLIPCNASWCDEQWAGNFLPVPGTLSDVSGYQSNYGTVPIETNNPGFFVDVQLEWHRSRDQFGVPHNPPFNRWAEQRSRCCIGSCWRSWCKKSMTTKRMRPHGLISEPWVKPRVIPFVKGKCRVGWKRQLGREHMYINIYDYIRIWTFNSFNIHTILYLLYANGDVKTQSG